MLKSEGATGREGFDPVVPMTLSSQPMTTQLPLSQNTHRLLQQLTTFLLSHHRREVIDLLAAVDQDDERHHSVTCSLTELGAWDPDVASRVVNSAGESMDVFDTALLSVQNQLLQELQDPGLTVKQHVHARLFGPPGFCSGSHGASPLSSIRSEMLNCLVTITGTVAKTGVVNVLESRKTYECMSCGYRFAVVVDDLTNDVSLPKQCPSTNASCNSDTFRENQMADKTFTNYQEIQVQEHFSDKINNNKKAAMVVLQDDLAESCQIGQVVHISGIVVRHASLMRGASTWFLSHRFVGWSPPCHVTSPHAARGALIRRALVRRALIRRAHPIDVPTKMINRRFQEWAEGRGHVGAQGRLGDRQPVAG